MVFCFKMMIELEEDPSFLSAAYRAESVFWWCEQNISLRVENVALKVLGYIALLVPAIPVLLAQSIKLCSSRGYTYWKGEGEERLPEKTQILHFNVCMFPGSLPAQFGGIRTAGERMEELFTLIRKEDPDIVFLSEFSGTLSPRLYEGLKEKYAHFFVNIGPKGFGMGASLAVLSRIPIVSEPRFIPSKCIREGDQRFMERGYFVMETASASYLYTHLHPKDSPRAQEIRQEQLDEILEITSQDGKPWVIVGDMNIDRESPGYNAMQEKGFVDHLDNVPTCEEESIDYVLTLKGSDISVKGKVIPTDHLSDHEAVGAVICAPESN